MNKNSNATDHAHPPEQFGRKLLRWTLRLFLALVALIGAAIFTPFLCKWAGFMPLVFNESFFVHQYCIKGLGTALRVYASDHNDMFPTHSGGYGDALLLLYAGKENYIGATSPLTGPCYDWKIFDEAIRTKSHVPESACGRVYVQGLKESGNPIIALAWDKQPTRGGDHWHGWGKLWPPLLREVCLLDGSMQRILEKDWPEFSKKQIELLVEAGVPRERAVALYAEKPKFSP